MWRRRPFYHEHIREVCERPFPSKAWIVYGKGEDIVSMPITNAFGTFIH